MKKIGISLTLLAVLVAGCGKTEQISFLSDYTRLEKVTDSTLIYSASENPLTGYKSFIVEDVQLGVSDSGLKPQCIEDMMEYMELSACKVVLSNYNLSDTPGKDTAILRVSVTSVDPDSPIMINPHAQTLSGSMVEVEIIDSITNDTLLCIVESRPVPLSRLSKWTTAKRTIDQWAGTLEDVLQQPVEIEKFAALPPVKRENITEIQIAKPKQPAENATIAQIID